MVANLAIAMLLAASGTSVDEGPVAVPAEFPVAGEPIANVAYSADLEAAGHENGRLPADALVDVSERGGCLLETSAAQSWLALAERAVVDGVDLVARWCYRSLAAQHRTYDRNCPMVLVDAGGDVVDPDEAAEDAELAVAVVRKCRVPTATPGNSNHGWGRAADIKAQGRLLSCESEAFVWLAENAGHYGWVHPEWAACGADKEEAWHWEWGGTMEPPPPPPPLRPVYGSRMLIY